MDLVVSNSTGSFFNFINNGIHDASVTILQILVLRIEKEGKIK